MLELLAAKVARAVLRGPGRGNALRLPDRRLRQAEGMPVKAIARTLGISRNTVRAALASGAPPQYRRAPAGSSVDAFEPRVRELLQAYPTMPVTVIAERIGWERGLLRQGLSGDLASDEDAAEPEI